MASIAVGVFTQILESIRTKKEYLYGKKNQTKIEDYLESIEVSIFRSHKTDTWKPTPKDLMSSYLEFVEALMRYSDSRRYGITPSKE